MDEVREFVLTILVELVDRWIGPELIFRWVFEEGGLTSVAERVMSGGSC